MTCPVCWFPGNDPAAARCVQCGAPLPVPEPQYAYQVPVSPVPISVNPISAPPPQPGYYAPLPVPRPRGSRVVLPLTVIVVVLVLASTVIAVVRLTGGDDTGSTAGSAAGSAAAGVVAPVGDSPPAPARGSSAAPAAPAGDPAAQAAAVDAVLDASIASRRKLNAAIDLVNKCTLIEQAIADLRTVGTERRSQMDSVGRFDLSAVPRGEELRGMLTEALSYSLAADQSFVLWAQAVQGSGCEGGGSGHYGEAQRQSQLASDAKARFLGAWNPVAVQYGLRSRSSADI